MKCELIESIPFVRSKPERDMRNTYKKEMQQFFVLRGYSPNDGMMSFECCEERAFRQRFSGGINLLITRVKNMVRSGILAQLDTSPTLTTRKEE